MRISACVMVSLVSLIFSLHVQAQTPPPGGFNGLDTHLGNLYRMSDAQTRSICPENFTGEKGKAGMSTDGPALHAARDLGQGWKVSPYVRVPAKTTLTLGEINGSGAIQQIWMTPAPIEKTRYFILRFYWDGENEPSIEVPMGDFFACGWGKYCQINSLPVCVNPGQRLQLLLDDALPQGRQGHAGEPRRQPDDYLLPDQLHVDRRARGRGLLARAIPPRAETAGQDGVHDPRWRPRPRAVRGHVHGLGGPQPGLVGRRRNQILPGWRSGIPHDLWHGNGGLLLRFLQLREP